MRISWSIGGTPFKLAVLRWSLPQDRNTFLFHPCSRSPLISKQVELIFSREKGEKPKVAFTRRLLSTNMLRNLFRKDHEARLLLSYGILWIDYSWKTWLSNKYRLLTWIVYSYLKLFHSAPDCSRICRRLRRTNQQDHLYNLYLPWVKLNQLSIKNGHHI